MNRKTKIWLRKINTYIWSAFFLVGAVGFVDSWYGLLHLRGSITCLLIQIFIFGMLILIIGIGTDDFIKEIKTK